MWNVFFRLKVRMSSSVLWTDNECLGSVECGEFLSAGE